MTIALNNNCTIKVESLWICFGIKIFPFSIVNFLPNLKIKAFLQILISCWKVFTSLNKCHRGHSTSIISSVNVTKSPVNCGFGHIHWRNLWWKALLEKSLMEHFIFRAVFPFPVNFPFMSMFSSILQHLLLYPLKT